MNDVVEKFKNGNQLSIVCIGDSTTSQEWCHPNWVDWLTFVFKQSVESSENVNRKIINSGVDGGNVYDYIKYFESTIGMYKPDLVIMSLGFNHIEKMETFEKDTQTLIDMIKGIGAKVALWSTYETPNSKYSVQLSKANEIYRNLCNKNDCMYIDIYNEFKKYSIEKLFTYTHQWENKEWNLRPGDIDFLHCNEIGNQIIAEKILLELFQTDTSFTETWIYKGGKMGNMFPIDLNEYRI